jgi:glucose-1-phosphate thymidylyltransferase
VRALVLSGGGGSRLRPITHTSAKQLIPVAGRPILFHALDAIRAAGINEVGVVVGPPNEEEVRAAVGSGERWDLAVTFVHQPQPLGLANAVSVAESFVRGEPFLMYLGDNVLFGGVQRFVHEFERTRPHASILLARVPDPAQFGVAVLDGSRVVRLVEKPKEPPSDLALVGVYLFDEPILEACAKLRPSWRGEYEITEAIQSLIDEGMTVHAEIVDGYWKDTGRPEDLLEANRMLLALGSTSIEGHVDDASTIDGTVQIGSGAKVTRSVLRGPLVVGSGCLVEDANVGPNVSLEPGCSIVRSTVSDSILMRGCQVLDVDALTGSILGRNVVVRHSGTPRAHRLVVGDQSVIEVD